MDSPTKLLKAVTRWDKITFESAGVKIYPATEDAPNGRVDSWAPRFMHLWDRYRMLRLSVQDREERVIHKAISVLNLLTEEEREERITATEVLFRFAQSQNAAEKFRVFEDVAGIPEEKRLSAEYFEMTRFS